MASGFVIRKNQYYDSVFLMSVNRRISDGIVEDVLDRLDDWLNAVQESVPISNQVHTFEEGLTIKPKANLAVISVPGEYAAREVRKALEAGLNVFLFSDNVSIDDELDLKQRATRKGLLVMGPDCGTSLIGGAGIGFANSVRRGPIGAIGAAGTGLQEFTSQVHNAGSGIAHAIGTGSHDLTDKIGGLTTFAALGGLEADPKTQVIALVSKPPEAGTLERLLKRIEACPKPVIGCFLGVDPERVAGNANFQFARTIDDAVQLAVAAVNGKPGSAQAGLTGEDQEMLAQEMTAWSPQQKYLRGILAGGTFCYQSQQILREAGIRVHSNSPLVPKDRLKHPDQRIEHTIVDMGEDFYMVGKPHPMIDGTMRRRRVLAESQDPQMAVLYLDFVLGYNASMDPVGELVDAIREAKRISQQRGGKLTVVASLCGTEADPQDLKLQENLLLEAGVLVYRSNARASAACCRLLGKG
jgi:succinyl-CoA synthetase alpha subunit